MLLQYPVPPPFDEAAYPVHEPYDVLDPIPTAWRLKIALGAPAGIDIDLHAITDGFLSTVPPWELPESWIGILDPPDGTFPDQITLYLQPDPKVQTDAFRQKLQDAGLGEQVLCFVYENVGANLLSTVVTDELGKNKSLVKAVPNPLHQVEVFVQGEAQVRVKAGDILGKAFTDAGGTAHVRFGVLTTTGYVDPVTFFSEMQDTGGDPTSEGELLAFTSLIGTNWPFLTSPMAPGRLYPAPVLYEAKHRFSMTDAEWRSVGDSQKALYWELLLHRVEGPSDASMFTFLTDDMANPFQLEAVAEFYTEWPEPALAASEGTHPLPDPTGEVNLQEGQWNLVLIDPFDHADLGSPALPKPAWHLKPHIQAGGQCDPAGPSSPYNPDEYRGVMFVIHNGEVVAWYKWTSYTSHKWEDAVRPRCFLSSALKGNVRYEFRSQTSRTRKFINYSFLVTEPGQANHVSARYYFRTNTPDDPDGKNSIMIHNGLTVDSNNHARSYIGSGGCIVSPSFYRFRNYLIDLYQSDFKQQHGNTDPDLMSLEGLTKRRSERLWNSKNFPTSDWNRKITGNFWVIRPDEPSQK